MFSPGPKRLPFSRSAASGPPDINFTVSPGSPGRTPLPGTGLNITPETVSTGRSSKASSSPIVSNNKTHYTNIKHIIYIIYLASSSITRSFLTTGSFLIFITRFLVDVNTAGSYCTAGGPISFTTLATFSTFSTFISICST